MGIPPSEIIIDGLCAGMDKIGELYDKKQYFVPDMLNSSQIFNKAMSKIKPLIKDQETEPRAKGVIGLVKKRIRNTFKTDSYQSSLGAPQYVFVAPDHPSK